METSHDHGLSSRLRTDNGITSGTCAAWEERGVEGYCFHDAITRQAEFAAVLSYGMELTVREAGAEEAGTRPHQALSRDTRTASGRASQDAPGGVPTANARRPGLSPGRTRDAA
jgi:hypothetical protein